MANTVDLKSTGSNPLRVRVPPPAPTRYNITPWYDVTPWYVSDWDENSRRIRAIYFRLINMSWYKPDYFEACQKAWFRISEKWGVDVLENGHGKVIGRYKYIYNQLEDLIEE